MTDSSDSSSALRPDPAELLKLMETKMPFGRYKGQALIDLPEPYLVWFSGRGFPPGHLGRQLRTVYEIKLNGLEYLFKPLRRRPRPAS